MGRRSVFTDPRIIHVMLDIETLGTNDDATILSIGAVPFRFTQKLTSQVKKQFPSFYKEVNLNDDTPLNTTAGTLRFWTEDANLTEFRRIMSPKKGRAVSESDVVNSFLDYLQSIYDKDYEVCLWGNGILFDNLHVMRKLPAEALGRLNIYVTYRHHMDVRTIVQLALTKSGYADIQSFTQQYKEGGTLHNALDDAEFQVRYVIGAYQLLTDDVAILNSMQNMVRQSVPNAIQNAVTFSAGEGSLSNIDFGDSFMQDSERSLW